MRPARFSLLGFLATMVACASPTAPSVEGVWGGTEASLSLARDGGVVTYLCGSGTMDSSWTLSRDGQLAGTGVHFFGGGPIPPGGQPPHPARYSARIDGNTMMLTVTVTDLGQTLGPFRMVRGGAVVSEMCV